MPPLRNLALIALLCLGLFAFPFMVKGNAPITIGMQVLIWIVFALSYNLVLGQTGLLSFGHAIFFGTGAYVASHLAVSADAGALKGLPLVVIPLLAFVAAGAFALLLGSFLAARVGVAFVMITLALSQLIIYVASSLDSIFGGESGISFDRAYGKMLGLTFGPSREAYWLVLAWALAAGVAMYVLTKTAFGQLAVSTRENEERVRFTGQNTYRVRLTAITIAGAFAGLAGALHAISVEQVSLAQFSLKTSAFALFMCIIGGTRHFYGPVLGAVILSILDKLLPDLTNAWQLYLGVVFILVVIFSKRGAAGMIETTWQRYRSLQADAGSRLFVDLLRLLAFALVSVGVIGLVEMLNAVGGGANFYSSAELRLFGMAVDPRKVLPWIICTLSIIAGALTFMLAVAHRSRSGLTDTGAQT